MKLTELLEAAEAPGTFFLVMQLGDDDELEMSSRHVVSHIKKKIGLKLEFLRYPRYSGGAPEYLASGTKAQFAALRKLFKMSQADFNENFGEFATTKVDAVKGLDYDESENPSALFMRLAGKSSLSMAIDPDDKSPEAEALRKKLADRLEKKKHK